MLRFAALTSSLALSTARASLISASSAMAAGLTTQMRLRSERVRRADRPSSIKIANKVRVNVNTAINYTLKTRLATSHPSIAAEWDFERNPGHIYPKLVGCGDITPYWWRCGDCGAPFKMSVEQRVLRHGGCSICERGRLESIADVSVGENLEGEFATATVRIADAYQRRQIEEDDDGQLAGERQTRRPLAMHRRQQIGKF